MPEFKNEKGETVWIEKKVAGRKRTLIIKGKTLTRVPRPKYQSRAKRLNSAIGSMEEDIGLFKSLIENIDDMTLKEAHKMASGLPTEINYSEVEELQGEIENWRDGMQGTNLENSEKFSQLENCVSYLDDSVQTLSSLSFEYNPDTDKNELKEALEEFVSEAESAISELQNVDFPGMY